MATIRIGIIGDGNVGGALARGLKRAGHDVRAVGNDKGAVRETAAWAEVVFLAVPFGAVDDVVKAAGSGLDGKTLVEASVLALARDIGFDAVDAGPLKNARLLEPFAFFNIQLGYVLGLGPKIGFKLLRS